MSIKDVKTLKLSDYESSALQQNLLEFSRQLTRVPLLGGNLIKDVSVSTTAIELAHGLGREPVGYIVIKSSAGVTLFDSTSLTPKVTIKLTASASATCNIWIF